jgi:general secretion pathway protein C
MTARALAFVIWASAAVCAMFWGLRLFVSAPLAPPHTAAVNLQAGVGGDLSRLLGREVVAAAPAAEPDAASRFKLLGVVAPKNSASGSSEGLVVMAVDGKPPRHYRVGSAIDGDYWLLSVGARSVAIGPRNGPATINLTLPPPPAAATGVLPGVAHAGPTGAMPPPPPAMPQPPQQVIDPMRVQQPVAPGAMPSPPPELQQQTPGQPR